MFSRKLLEKIEGWRGNITRWEETNYKGATPITKRLLQYWFYEEHFLEQDLIFDYWRCQREAIEVLIYCYEVLKVRTIRELASKLDFQLIEQAALLEEFQHYSAPELLERQNQIKEAFVEYLTKSSIPKLAFNMATGSGKTMVMALAIAWMYLNNYSRTFLMICPNTIVLDRLALAFENLAIFKQFPIVPPEYWANDKVYDFNFKNVQVVKQNEGSTEFGTGVIFLTNIQQLYDKETPRGRNQLQLLLDNARIGEFINPLVNRILRYDCVTVINDEAHHSAAPEWSRIIRYVHDNARGFHLQLDFSATNKYYSDGSPFEHIVYEYGLKQAIDPDGIVKDIEIQTYANMQDKIVLWSDERQKQFLVEEGLKKLGELKQTYADTPAKPVLFILTSTIDEADEIGNAIIEDLDNPYTNEEVLVIHTNKTTGEILKRDLETARRVAREIDEPENKVEVIVSVLMLQEGWDVKSVYCIVPLRAAGSQIMVEQIIGRGLRRRFPHKNRDQEYEVEEKLWIIEHPNFKRFWEAEKKRHGYDFHIDSGRPEKPPKTVRVDEAKLEYDIEVPILSGGTYQTRAIDATLINVDAMPAPKFYVAAFDVRNPQRVHKRLGEREAEGEQVELKFYTFYNFVKAKLVNMIVEDNKLVGTNVKAVIDRKLDEYIAGKLFCDFDRDNPEHVKRLNLEPIVDEILKAFRDQIRKIAATMRDFEPSLRTVRVSETKPKQTSKDTYIPKKSVFNQADYDSELEHEFMERLDTWEGIEAWSRVVPFKIPYYDEEYGFHYYIPDFIVKADGRYYLVETKGEGFAKLKDTEAKQDVAEEWIAKANESTEVEWAYLFVLDEKFNQYKGLGSFDAFVKAVG
ncbi:MAG: DEAD/DEAH box helicase family protein [Anaerolineae bacterium]